MDAKSKKEVLIVFKTHLDIGFTDYAQNVIDNYMNSFIPKAVSTGYKLRDTDTPFVWTVGAWLIWEALKRDKAGVIEKAIRDGIITWHALPYTSHTELMSEKLFEYGLSISQRLDEHFGKKTTAAKMTDVPGHTIGMVPVMSRNGVDFLHIGVNPGTSVPRVPSLFRWRCDGNELIVMYEETYGEKRDFGEFVVYFAHTNDNLGPQTEEEIASLYAALRRQYPEHEVKAATLEDVAQRVRQIEDMPVLEKEIGDTWIHGAGTDPKKVGMYRELLRTIEGMDIEGTDLQDYDLTDNLLLVPEHTWGMSIERFFDNSKDWLFEDFKRTKDTDRMAVVEKSWQEQRDYVHKAENMLGVKVDYELQEPSLEGYTAMEDAKLHIEISWQLFNFVDYSRYTRKYSVLNEENSRWVLWDNTKPGLPAYPGRIETAKLCAAFQKGEKTLYKLEFDKEVQEEHGLPYFWVKCEGGKIEVDWFGKQANRLPQAFWLKFTGLKEDWEIQKMSHWIKPENVVGSPWILAVDKGVRNGEVQITSLDACLVAPYGRKLLDYPLADEALGQQDLYFNLYNNIWNTNFPMWYSDDTRFRFEASLLCNWKSDNGKGAKNR